MSGVILLNVLQWTGQPRTAEGDPVPQVSHAEAEKPHVHSFVSQSSFPFSLPSTSLFSLLPFCFLFPILFPSLFFLILWSVQLPSSADDR